MEIRCKYQLCRRWRKTRCCRYTFLLRFYCDPISQYFAKVVNGTYTDLQTNTNTTTNANDIPYIQAVGNVITAKEMGQMHLHQQLTIVYLQGVAGVTAF